MVARSGWVGWMLLSGACAPEERAVEPPQAQSESEAVARPLPDVLTDGAVATKRVPVELGPSIAEREAAEAFLAERRRELSELTLSASDRALLEEFAAIQALYAQNSTGARAQAAVSAEVPAADGASFGLETRDHRLWLVRGAEGKRYTVTTKAGAIVAEAIDDATLGQEFPELHELLHGAVDRVGDER